MKQFLKLIWTSYSVIYIIKKDRKRSLRCSRPTHSSKNHLVYIHAEGLERLRRRQRKRIA